jgi:rod shape-determining protein MreD
MYKKIIINTFLITCLLIFQIAFLSGLPVWGQNFNAIIVVLVFILGLYNLKIAMTWSIICGLVLDIYSFSFFGIYLFSLPLAIILTDFLLNNFFTNRSLYSFLALTASAYLSFELLVIGGNLISGFIFGQNIGLILGGNFWFYKLGGLVVNLVATALIFYILNFFSKKFKPAILAKMK